MKQTIGWAIVNDHGKIPLYTTQSGLLMIFKTKKQAQEFQFKSDKIIQVLVERKSLDI
jgi:hypothetical protein